VAETDTSLRDVCLRLRGAVAASRMAQLVRAMREHEMQMRAAALAYRTVLTLVPLLAILLAALKEAGFGTSLGPFLREQLPMLDEESLRSLLAYVGRANARSIGGAGALGLALAAWSMLSNVERTLNHIFAAPQVRKLWQRLIEFMCMLVLGVGIVSSSVAIQALLKRPQLLPMLLGSELSSGATTLGLFALPWLSSFFGFVLIYAWMPNRTLPLRLPLLAAGLASVAFQLLQMAFLELQFAFASYHAIYGALAQLPILLIWIYTSWLVVLIGAEGIALALERGSQEWSKSGAAQESRRQAG